MSINRKYIESGYSPDGRRKTGKSKIIHAHNCRVAGSCAALKAYKGRLGQNLCEIAPGNASKAKPIMWDSDCPHFKSK